MRGVIQGTFRAALKWQWKRSCADCPCMSAMSIAEGQAQHRRSVTQAEGEEKPRCAACRAGQRRWCRRARRCRPCHDWRVKELVRSQAGKSECQTRWIRRGKEENVPLISPADRRHSSEKQYARGDGASVEEVEGCADAPRALLCFSLKRRAGLASSLFTPQIASQSSERGSRAELESCGRPRSQVDVFASSSAAIWDRTGRIRRSAGVALPHHLRGAGISIWTEQDQRALSCAQRDTMRYAMQVHCIVLVSSPSDR